MNDGDGVRRGGGGQLRPFYVRNDLLILGLRRCRTRAKGSWNDHEC